MQAEINTLSGDSNKAVRDNLLKEIAKKEFQLFVVNTHAVAVQGENGKYYTKYIPFTPYVLENMIRNNGSIGCYQHAFHSNYIRWICMDFDCLKGKPIDLYGLYEECVRPVAIYLKERNIRFLLEFSGRRGIHVWIIFDRMISKQTGFTIINKILSDVPEVSYLINSGQWGLDKFPANGSYRKNIVGKQVKFPLSTHMNGGRSYFFEDSFAEKFDTESEEFCSEQLRIISDYVPESEGEICKKLGIEENNEVNCTLYKKYNLISSYTASADEMISILSETEVYRRIFERMRLGQTQQYDWLVVLGTFCCFDTCVDILKSIFETYPYYDAEITIDNIRKFKDKYFPATFKRWPIEIKYHELKCSLKLEEFNGATPVAIMQEFFISLMLSNIASLIKNHVDGLIDETANPANKYRYQANRSFIIDQLKYRFARYIGSQIDINTFEDLVSLVYKNMLQIQPGRFFKRKKNKAIRRTHFRNKKVAF